MNRLTKEDLKDIVTGDLFKGFLSPELAVRKMDVHEMGSYTGIIMKKPAESKQALPVFNLDAACDALNAAGVTDKTEAARTFAHMMDEFIKKIVRII